MTPQHKFQLKVVALYALICCGVMAFVVLLCSCGPKAPDNSLVAWGQEDPGKAAKEHARAIGGRAYVILPTGSMEPFLTGGDYEVVDLRFSYEKIEPAFLLLYQANWLPASSPPVTHMAAAKSGDEWIMDGVANRHYERGTLRMTRADYRGKIVRVYTRRPKP